LFFIVPALVFASITALHHDFASAWRAVEDAVFVLAAADAATTSAMAMQIRTTDPRRVRITAPLFQS
jgi:hypothetical protein